jgi:hypothetical protein
VCNYVPPKNNKTNIDGRTVGHLEHLFSETSSNIPSLFASPQTKTPYTSIWLIIMHKDEKSGYVGHASPHTKSPAFLAVTS